MTVKPRTQVDSLHQGHTREKHSTEGKVLCLRQMNTFKYKQSSDDYFTTRKSGECETVALLSQAALQQGATLRKINPV